VTVVGKGKSARGLCNDCGENAPISHFPYALDHIQISRPDHGVASGRGHGPDDYERVDPMARFDMEDF
jgi:hypothetical protein